MAAVSVFFIRLYQFLFSPDQGVLFPSRVRTCCFYPSCSAYTIEALQTHGFLRGWRFGAKRVFRCHPWQEGGYDPVHKNT